MQKFDDTATGQPAATAGPPPLRTFLAVLVIVELASGATQSFFAPVMYSVAQRWHVGVGALSWTVTAFTLSMAVSTPVFTKLGDLYGYRRVLRVEVIIVTIGSLLVALAPNFPMLITGRALQGMFAAYLPLMFGLVRSRYPRDATRRAIGYLNAALVFGILCTLVFVGMLERYSRTATPALWLPVAVTVAGLIALFATPAEARPAHTAGERIDWAGALLLSGGLATALFGISEGPKWGWSSGQVVGCLVGGVLLLAAWVAVELRVASPLADVRFLFRPRFLPVYAVGCLLYFVVTGGQLENSTFGLLPPKQIGYGLGLSVFQTCLLAAFWLVFTFLAVVATPRLGRALGLRMIPAIGGAFAVVGYFVLTFSHNNLACYVVFAGLVYLGLGFIESSTRILVVDQLPADQTAIGEGVYELSITLGGAVGSAVFGAIASSHVARPGLPSEHGYELCWAVSAGVCALAVLVAGGYAAVGRRSAQPQPDVLAAA